MYTVVTLHDLQPIITKFFCSFFLLLSGKTSVYPIFQNIKRNLQIYIANLISCTKTKYKETFETRWIFSISMKNVIRVIVR